MGVGVCSIHLLLCAYRPTVSNENTETLTLKEAYNVQCTRRYTCVLTRVHNYYVVTKASLLQY